MSETETKAAGEEKPQEKAAEAAAEPTENGEADGEGDKAADKEEPPKEMRAVVLTGFGGLKSVKVLKRPEPTLAEGEVLVRVRACGLNFQDLMARQGAIDSPPKTPFVLGFECAGEVEAVGEGVDNFKVGDRVVALPEYRAWAELVAVPAKYVFALPDGMPFLDAAAVTMNYLIAYILLFELGGLQPGRSVLVHSAGGGVGQAVAQLCATVDEVEVFGVASKAKHEALTAGGSITHLLERGTDYAAEVRKLRPEGVDLVLDCLCGEECNRGYALLKPMGKYILYGSSNIVTGETKSLISVAKSWWQVDKVSPVKLFEDSKSIGGFNLRHLLYQQNGAPYVQGVVAKVFDLWKQGKIKPVVDSTWALEDVPEAMQKMHDRKNIGKIILDPSMEPKPKPATPAKGKAKNADKEDKKKDEEKKEEKEDKKEEKKEENGEAPAPENAEKEASS